MFDLNYFASLGQRLAEEFAQKIGGKISANVGAAAGQAMSSELQTQIGTVKSYKSSADPAFTVTCKTMFGIPGLANYKSLKELMGALTLLTQPKIVGGLVRPNLYDYTALKNLTDTASSGAKVTVLDNELVTIRLGSWFQASGLYISNLDPNVPLIFDENGAPIGCTLSFTFTPYRVLEATEIANWFLK